MRKNYQSIFKKIIKPLSVLIFALIFLAGCSMRQGEEYSNDKQIYLYGEMHAVEEQILEEYELWKYFYDNHGMRNLFIEAGNFDAYFLNEWMKEDSDEILDMIFENSANTFGSSIYLREFYEKIKNECPETVFYGTDVGHLFDTTGELYLEYLRDQKPFDMDRYKRVKEVMKQGEHWYNYIEDPDKFGKIMDYREGKLVENFIYEFDKLDDKRVMGIYGGYHVDNSRKIEGPQDPNMADQLRAHYGDIIYTRLLYDEVSLNKYKDMTIEDVKRSR